jgi:hypothetical protein
VSLHSARRTYVMSFRDRETPRLSGQISPAFHLSRVPPSGFSAASGRVGPIEAKCGSEGSGLRWMVRRSGSL